jgi:hypothetical protein
MRKTNSLQPVSETEQDTREVEARKISAEGDLLTISETKKKIENEF